MIGAVHSRPLRFLLLMMLSWVGLRVASEQLPRIGPSPAPLAAASPVLAAWTPQTGKRSTPSGRATIVALFPPALIPVPPPSPSLPAPARRPDIANRPDASIDLLQFIHFSVGFANRRYGTSSIDVAAFPATASPPPSLSSLPAQDRWRASSWVLWRDGSTVPSDAAAVGRLGGSQAGIRVEYLLSDRGSARMTAYGRLTSALQRPAAPEAAAGVAFQPVHTIPVTIAAERRIALGAGARNATAIMAVGGFGPMPVAKGLEAEAYAQAGVVGLRRTDLFMDGKMSLLAPVRGAPVRVGAALSGGAQPGVSRLDASPELQLRLPLPNANARMSLEWRQRIAGDARPASGLALTLGADF